MDDFELKRQTFERFKTGGTFLMKVNGSATQISRLRKSGSDVGDIVMLATL